REAAAGAALTEEEIAGCAAHLGLAGILSDADAVAMAAALPFARVTVTDDRPTAIAGALGDGNGVLAAVGTGTFVAARRDGATRSFGGWGFRLGDQASGAWLGRGALERCLLMQDGLAAPSDLTRALLARFDGDSTAIVAFAREARPADYAALAPDVFDAAEAGDANATRLVERGASYLNACIAASELRDGDVLCLTGGLGPRYAPHLNERARLRPPQGTALDGALAMARAAQGMLETTP
ncbi:MAG: BadF/BadG/BcrA/BcrD ATPase family protein, partial [Pseudomonadota bacterium]